MRVWQLLLLLTSLWLFRSVHAIDSCRDLAQISIAHLTDSESGLVSLVPSYVRVAPFDGSVDFQLEDGRIQKFNMFKRPVTFYIDINESSPAQISMDILRRAADNFFPMVALSSFKAPRTARRLPLEIDSLYEQALGHPFALSEEEKDHHRQNFSETRFFERLSRIEDFSNSDAAKSVRNIFHQIRITNDAVYVELRTQYQPQDIHSLEADVSRSLLDIYFSALQRVYRKEGSSDLSKAMKLLDSWIEYQRGGLKPRVFMVYERPIWKALMLRMHELMMNPDASGQDTFSRTAQIRNALEIFLPQVGMMVTNPFPHYYEFGRLFNNRETDPLRVFWSDGLSPVPAIELQKRTNDLYAWVLQSLPEQTTIWARAFTKKHSLLFQRYGFKPQVIENSVQGELFSRHRTQIETYWNVKESWVLEQSRDEWLKKILGSKNP